MAVYYNENDPFTVQWIKSLIKCGLLPDGDVDDRDIKEVSAYEIKKYQQCHFFCGIGGWSYALQIAQWPADEPVWTGSCPCQPFSVAGNDKGFDDPRDLWPVWFNLIKECQPPTIFGEQVARAIAHHWLDRAFSNMEAEGYACGAAVLPACSVGAPHKRDRLWFVGHSQHAGRSASKITKSDGKAVCDSAKRAHRPMQSKRADHPSSMANSECERLQGHLKTADGALKWQAQASEPEPFDCWPSSAWLKCPDGKDRIFKPSIGLLDNGLPNRVGRVRGYGNAIVPQVAAEFILAFKDCLKCL